MTDYFKIWIMNVAQINDIMRVPSLDMERNHKVKTGEIIEYPVKGKWKGFELELKSATWLEITGSLHKYWNNGTNENDFKSSDVKIAIENFCAELNLNPKLAHIKNLEIGVNVNPIYSASEIIDEIICYKNTRPLRPYEGRNDQFYFIEFKKGNHYLKIYDKGKQYKTINTLRIEYKEMRSRELAPLGARTLYDLTNNEVLKELGRKLVQYCKFLVFNDSTLNVAELNKKEQSIYKTLENPNKWKIEKGKKNSTIYRRERNFISIVKTYGKRDIYNYIETIVNDKILELLQNNICIDFPPNYNGKPLQKRFCLSCSKELHPDQKPNSKFCSSKFVGDAAAHQCRNLSSNPRNNLKKKIVTLQARGLLFDITPFHLPLFK